MADRRLQDLRRRLALRRGQYAKSKGKRRRFIVHRVHALRAAIARRKRELRKGRGAGPKAVRFLLKRAGWHEQPWGSNDAPFLKHWRDRLGMAWMRGQPWCGFACMAAYYYGAGKRLPADTPSTIAIANRARSGNGFRAVRFEDAKVGDLVVFNFGSGAPKHVGLARGRPSGGVIPTVEGNTSSGNGGSQANGGGIYLRVRSRGLVHTIARPK